MPIPDEFTVRISPRTRQLLELLKSDMEKRSGGKPVAFGAVVEFVLRFYFGQRGDHFHATRPLDRTQKRYLEIIELDDQAQ